jgi:hypothetical protein
MPSDRIMVALIAEAMGAATRPRRIAASLLLEVLRSDPAADDFETKVEIIEAKEAADVANELRVLVAAHGLNGAT